MMIKDIPSFPKIESSKNFEHIGGLVVDHLFADDIRSRIDLLLSSDYWFVQK